MGGAVMPLPLTHKDLRSWRAHLRARGGERRYSRNDTCSGAFVPLLLKTKAEGLICESATAHWHNMSSNYKLLLSFECGKSSSRTRSPSPHRHLEHPRQKRSILTRQTQQSFWAQRRTFLNCSRRTFRLWLPSSPIVFGGARGCGMSHAVAHACMNASLSPAS